MLLLGSHAVGATPPIAVPATTFTQGAATLPDAPPRTVVLSAFWLDAHEVTIQAFEQFTAAPGYRDQAVWADGWAWHQQNPDGAGAAARRAGRGPDHPVVAVSWHEADAYCRWRGGQLPTEAQWERVACDGDGPYAWGDDESAPAAWYAGSKYGRVESVQTRPASQADPSTISSLGALHMAGNVWEWTADWYHRDSYASDGEATTDPTGLEAGTWRVLRGGSYMNLPSYCRCTHREPARPERVSFTVGFRCAYTSSP
ncbi:MAG: sulfatase modifying factor 1 [Myxococcota bacterium]|jgi:sulfatase modifying factor 1